MSFDRRTVCAECAFCGLPAVLPDSDGLFTETDIQGCRSCAYPGSLSFYEDAYGEYLCWTEADPTAPVVKQWREKYPQLAEILDRENCLSGAAYRMGFDGEGGGTLAEWTGLEPAEPDGPTG